MKKKLISFRLELRIGFYAERTNHESDMVSSSKRLTGIAHISIREFLGHDSWRILLLMAFSSDPRLASRYVCRRDPSTSHSSSEG